MGEQKGHTTPQEAAAASKLGGRSDSTTRRRRSSRPASTPARVWGTFDSKDDGAILVRRSDVDISLQPREHANAAAASSQELTRKPVVSCASAGPCTPVDFVSNAMSIGLALNVQIQRLTEWRYDETFTAAQVSPDGLGCQWLCRCGTCSALCTSRSDTRPSTGSLTRLDPSSSM